MPIAVLRLSFRHGHICSPSSSHTSAVQNMNVACESYFALGYTVYSGMGCLSVF